MFGCYLPHCTAQGIWMLLFHFTKIMRDHVYGWKFPTYWYIKNSIPIKYSQNPILMESYTPPETRGITSIICLHSITTYTYESPTHQTLSQTVETLFLDIKGFVNMSASCSDVSLGLIRMVPSETKLLKWWNLIAMYLVQGVDLGALATMIQMLLSSQSFHLKIGIQVRNPNILPITFIN